jgi:catechol 2,3-dioxygenase-like lactoylglutathione lyase family enzyme
MSDRPKVAAISPIIAVSDLQRSIDFYSKLGFISPNVWGDPPCFAMMNRDRHEIMLSVGAVTPNGPRGALDLYVYVADANAEADALRAAGVTIASEPTKRVYEMLELEVLDPDGYRICFASDVTR